MSREFTNPNVGHKLRVSQDGKEVSITFECGTQEKATAMMDRILDQLKQGYLNFSMMAGGEPTLTEAKVTRKHARDS